MDAILLDVLWNRLVGVVNEQAAALMRTSFTSVLREAGLVRSERDGKNIVYHLQMSVLEDALMTLANSFGLGQSTSLVLHDCLWRPGWSNRESGVYPTNRFLDTEISVTNHFVLSHRFCTGTALFLSK